MSCCTCVQSHTEQGALGSLWFPEPVCMPVPVYTPTQSWGKQKDADSTTQRLNAGPKWPWDCPPSLYPPCLLSLSWGCWNATQLTITVISCLKGSRGLQVAAQGPIATVAVVEAAVDVHRVLGVGGGWQ